jgi:hypothetical protein
MARRLFTAGCWILIAMALVHLLGHAAMMSNPGQTEGQRQMLALMRGERRDMGLGMVRSTMDILAGFSLAFSLFGLSSGLLGLIVRRHQRAAPGLLRQAAIAYAGTFGVLSAIGLRYWFPAPLAFVLAAWLCFLGAVAAGREPDVSRAP